MELAGMLDRAPVGILGGAKDRGRFAGLAKNPVASLPGSVESDSDGCSTSA